MHDNKIISNFALLNNRIMAIPIKSAPVLEGKAAREFYERWKKAVDPRSKEEVQKLNREWKEFFAKPENCPSHD